MNLFTTDVQAVGNAVLYGHFVWLGLMETLVVLAILWSRLGVTILLALIYTCFVLLLQIICGKCTQLIWYERKLKDSCFRD